MSRESRRRRRRKDRKRRQDAEALRQIKRVIGGERTVFWHLDPTYFRFKVDYRITVDKPRFHRQITNIEG